MDTPVEVVAVLDELEAEEQRSLDLVNTATVLFERDGTEPFEVIAVRQDLLGVVAVGGGQPTYVQLECDAAGTLHTTEESDLRAALDWLDERSQELLPFAADGETLRNLRRAVTAGDRTEMERLIAADFTAHVHTRLGFATMNRAEYIGVDAETASLDAQTVVPKTIAITERLSLHLYRTRTSGSDAFESDGLILVELAEGQVERVDIWDSDDLETALAKFDELADDARQPGLRNRAVDLADRAPHLRSQDLEVVAVRGERLFLAQQPADPDAGSAATLTVWEADDDGLVVDVAHFDGDDLAGAHTELDRRYLAAEGAPYAHALASPNRLNEALTRRAVDEIGATMTEDFVLIDHRSLGWGTLDRDGTIERVRSAVEVSAAMRSVHRTYPTG